MNATETTVATPTASLRAVKMPSGKTCYSCLDNSGVLLPGFKVMKSTYLGNCRFFEEETSQSEAGRIPVGGSGRTAVTNGVTRWAVDADGWMFSVIA